jgi:ABC-type transport system substrate-binding protein
MSTAKERQEGSRTHDHHRAVRSERQKIPVAANKIVRVALCSRCEEHIVAPISAGADIEQWDPKSPWHDRRVRLAASLAIDRQGLNQAETLGLSRPVGSMVPRDFEFALPFEPHPYDPKRARQLLVEAGYPNGFDAGELNPFPPYISMGEALSGWLQAIGIRTKIRSMERATFMTAWREKKLRGVVLTISGISGNAARRLEPFVTSTGALSYGALPEVDDLFKRQARSSTRRSARRCSTRSNGSCSPGSISRRTRI